jgi:hypothetical protein
MLPCRPVPNAIALSTVFFQGFLLIMLELPKILTLYVVVKILFITPQKKLDIFMNVDTTSDFNADIF